MLHDSGLLKAFFTIFMIVVPTIGLIFLVTKKKSKEEKMFKLDMNSIGWDEISNEHNQKSRNNETVLKADKMILEPERKDPPQPQSFSSKTNDEKPFQSSYYYAHNHLKKTGGYSDGLKAEDYQMNEPKLLKKTSSDGFLTKSVVNKGIRIDRYLWDDDGNLDGVARIIIENLPNESVSSVTLVENSGISKDDVKCKLLGTWGNGLMVQFRRVMEEKELRYFLSVPRMYGEADDVKVLVKTKKIIIKLNKKKDPENLKAWPRLQSNLKSNSSAFDDDEDLFAL